ncbi:MAG TPA: TlyA family rRNA (cytidine-2'-O)-methyltransferase, partial [Dehalococcoidia bacterium]|nr:TlyA family rRNA (cytidine-2'-O)-methyltransferase [Dehalococcoidia bacterium]
MKNQIRLDELLVERKISKNLDQARKDIWTGKIKLLKTEYRVLLPHVKVDSNSKIQLVSSKKFVSRGGDKLNFALDDFNIDVSGK